MTSKDGSSYGQAKIHDKVRIDIAQADARQLAQTVKRDLIRWFVAMNFGPQELYPRVEWPLSEPEDMAAISTAVATLVPLGLRVAQREMRDKLGLSEPAAEDELLHAAAAPVPRATGAKPPDRADRLSLHGAGCRCGGCLEADLLAAARRP